MSDIKAGVVLSLKDKFSQKITQAGAATDGFAGKAVGALNKINSALSGTAAKLGAFGVSLSMGAAAKEIIDLDAKMMRLGVQADVSDKKVNKLKNKIFETAQAPDIKIGTDDLTAALDSVIERTGDLDFAEENLRNIGLAIQATGASGADIGGLFAEFQKMGMGADEAMHALDTLTVQGKAGAFTLQNLSSLGPRTITAYTKTGRSGAQALQEMGAALQVIRMGTGSSEQAATAFEAVMRDLTNPDKQQKLKQLGVAVRDEEGNFRSITDIMHDTVLASEGVPEILGQIFDSEAMRAFNYSLGEYNAAVKNGMAGNIPTLEKFNEMMGDGSTIQKDSARNAATLSANLKNVQTAFVKFADANLTKPLGVVADMLNKLAENPKRIQAVFKTMAVGIGSIVAIKGLASITSLVSNIKNLKGGSANLNLTAGTSSNGLPVFVTNVGDGLRANSNASKVKVSKGKLSFKQGTALGGAAALSAALTAIPNMIGELSTIDNNQTLKGKEKTKAKGGAIGAAVGSIGGAAGGAMVGAAIGSVVPIVGTAIGALVGGGIGMLGGWIGRKAGEKIGEAVGKNEVIPESAAVKKELARVSHVPASPAVATLEGSAVMEEHVYIHDERTRIERTLVKNDIPIKYPTGSIKEARGLTY